MLYLHFFVIQLQLQTEQLKQSTKIWQHKIVVACKALPDTPQTIQGFIQHLFFLYLSGAKLGRSLVELSK